MENVKNFGEFFTNETFETLKNTITAFLKNQGASNATLEFPDKNVYIHSRKDNVEIHIVSGTKEVPEFPEDDDEEE